VCSFGPAAVVDEWTLFRAGGGGSGSGTVGSAGGSRQDAVTAFLTGTPLGAASNAAPASVCAKAGADLRTLKCAEPACTLGEPNVALCLFKDGSMIGADALKAGPKAANAGGVAQLAAALQG
jgi:hypothetical protein